MEKNIQGNQLVIGSSGTGKTYHYVLPQMFSWEGNILLVTSVCPEMADLKRLRNNGYCINVLHPSEREKIAAAICNQKHNAVIVEMNETDKMDELTAILSKVEKQQQIPLIIFFDGISQEIPSLHRFFATPSKNIRYVFTAQSYTQLETTYSKEVLIDIMNHCSSLIYLGSIDTPSESFYLEVQDNLAKSSK